MRPERPYPADLRRPVRALSLGRRTTDYAAGAAVAVVSVVPTVVNVAWSRVPTVVTPAMMATAMRAAIRPYSIAVAPERSPNSFIIDLRINASSSDWNSDAMITGHRFMKSKLWSGRSCIAKTFTSNDYYRVSDLW